MNCPYCGKEMQKGEVQSGSWGGKVLNAGEQALWIPEAECKKIVPKVSVSLKVNGEGYYCEKCAKVVGIFEKRGADFFQ